MIFKKELGYGNSAIVREGLFDGRPVAVKCLLIHFSELMTTEVECLIKSDSHPNIVQYYGKDSDHNFHYLALEKCSFSLYDLITKKETFENDEYTLWNKDYPSPCLLSIMRQIVSGLQHLHSLGIVHRDLKPTNIMIKKEASLCAKLSDMGIWKQIPRGLSSVENSFSGRGTLGWQAPELSTIDGVKRNVDLFSLGCIFFFCLTKGVPLFDSGPEFERTTRELGERFLMISHMPAAVDLVERLVSSIADHRPKIEEVIKHPMLWDATTRLAFIRDASDRIKQAGPGSTLVTRIEDSRETIFRNGWDSKMDKNLLVEISKRRQYNYKSASHLVRALRNTSVYYNELPNDVKKNFESKYPEGLDNYFTEKFPHLLFEVYKVICEVCAGEEVFERYIYES